MLGVSPQKNPRGLLNLIGVRGISSTVKCKTGTGYITGDWVIVPVSYVSTGRVILPTATIFNERMSDSRTATAVVHCSNMRLAMYSFHPKDLYERESNAISFVDPFTIDTGMDLVARGYVEGGKYRKNTVVRCMNSLNGSGIVNHDVDKGWWYSLGDDIPEGMFLYHGNKLAGYSLGGGRAIHAERFFDCVGAMKKSASNPGHMWYRTADFIWSEGTRELLAFTKNPVDKRGILIDYVFNESLVPQTGFLMSLVIEDNDKEYTFNLLRGGHATTNPDICSRVLSISEVLSLITTSSVVTFKYSTGDVKVVAADDVSGDGALRMEPTKLMITDYITKTLSRATLGDILASTGGTLNRLNADLLTRSLLTSNDQLIDKVNNHSITHNVNNLFSNDAAYMLRGIDGRTTTVFINNNVRANRVAQSSQAIGVKSNVVVINSANA